MDSSTRARLSGLAHSHHPICAPLADDSVAALLGRAVRTGTERVLDLGCGEAAWLLHALTAHPGVTADGVDINEGALARARERAERLGVGQRLGLHPAPAAEFDGPEPYDLVLCVGSTHAFDGLLPTLAAIRRHLAPGGRVLVGEGYWQREPDQAALDGFGGASADDFDDLPTLVDKVIADGWVPVAGHQSTQAELDDYEWAWTGSLADWALGNPADPLAADAARLADEHRHGWLHGYRGTFGFTTLLLRSTS
jgi:SAM-dependent methyltransferase